MGAAFLQTPVPLEDSADKIQFGIWDTAGSERYKALAPMYYRGAEAAIIVYDITSFESFEGAKSWVHDLKLYGQPNVVIALAANKCGTPPTHLSRQATASIGLPSSAAHRPPPRCCGGGGSHGTITDAQGSRVPAQLVYDVCCRRAGSTCPHGWRNDETLARAAGPIWNNTGW